MDARNRGAIAVQALRDHPERFLATVQTGITVVGAAAAAYGGEVFAQGLSPLIARVPSLAPYASKIALASVIMLVSYLSLVLGELVPKSLAMRSAEGYALWAGRPLLFLSYIARPFIWFLTLSSNVVLRLFGDKTSFTESRLSPDEIQEMVDEAAKVGSLDARTSELASRALDFRNLTAAAVMVPRGEVLALPRDATLSQIQQTLSQRSYRRLPVYEGNHDNIVGYVSLKDMLEPALRGEPPPLASILRPIHFVPGTIKAVDLLQDLQARRTSIAIVVDEQGGLMGLVTLEDLAEEVMGEILSEQDSPQQLVLRQPDGTALLQGSAPIHEVNRELALELPEGTGYATIAGLCIALAGRIPTAGSRFTTEDGITFEIMDASPRRIRSVRITLPAPPAEEPAKAPAGEH